MPKYNYECGFCQKIFEVNHSMSKNYTGESCPSCNKTKALEKLPSYFTKFYRGDGSKPEHQVGEIVREAIKEMTEDLHTYKVDTRDEDQLND